MAINKTKQQLAREAQIHLEETISAAHHILSSMSDELCDAALWPSSTASVGSNMAPNPPHPLHHSAPPSSLSLDASESTHPMDISSGGGGGMSTGGSLDQARHKFKAAITALRASIIALCAISSQQDNVLGPKSDSNEIERLEAHAASLRKEIEVKNKHVKLLIDQLRNLIIDISMWQSPCSL